MVALLEHWYESDPSLNSMIYDELIKMDPQTHKSEAAPELVRIFIFLFRVAMVEGWLKIERTCVQASPEVLRCVLDEQDTIDVPSA